MQIEDHLKVEDIKNLSRCYQLTAIYLQDKTRLLYLLCEGWGGENRVHVQPLSPTKVHLKLILQLRRVPR